jgi:galactonate dehydratase
MSETPDRESSIPHAPIERRSVLKGSAAVIGLSALAAGAQAAVQASAQAAISPKDNLKITKLETFLVKPRWLFLKMHTNAGIVGLGEPILEGRAKTCAEAVHEMEPYLIGKDPRRVMHHWQAIYRHSFYRGGPLLTSALSGVEQAMWDITGKAMGVPIYALFGGPTRDKVRLYKGGTSPETIQDDIRHGFTAFKVGPEGTRNPRIVENKKFVDTVADNFRLLREAGGDEIDIGIDFHGRISAPTAKLLIKALEPYQPMFIEEPVNCQNHDIMAEIARGTFLPIATGERVFTKWGFREVLEKGAASILQPDICHCGGIFEARLIAGMAESYYAAIAPHNPLGPIATAACVQLDASIPNFVCQEHRSLGEGYFKEPLVFNKGYVELPTKPGLGVELDDNAMADKIDHDWHNPEAYDEDDGSVTDW